MKKGVHLEEKRGLSCQEISTVTHCELGRFNLIKILCFCSFPEATCPHLNVSENDKHPEARVPHWRSCVISCSQCHEVNGVCAVDRVH